MIIQGNREKTWKAVANKNGFPIFEDQVSFDDVVDKLNESDFKSVTVFNEKDKGIIFKFAGNELKEVSVDNDEKVFIGGYYDYIYDYDFIGGDLFKEILIMTLDEAIEHPAIENVIDWWNENQDDYNNYFFELNREQKMEVIEEYIIDDEIFGGRFYSPYEAVKYIKEALEVKERNLIKEKIDTIVDYYIDKYRRSEDGLQKQAKCFQTNISHTDCVIDKDYQIAQHFTDKEIEKYDLKDMLETDVVTKVLLKALGESYQ